MSPHERATLVDRFAAGCATAFVAILALSAYWDPSIRVLHVFEAVPYVVSAMLCLRRRKVGYMIGAAGGGVWFVMAGMLTTFVRNGFERVSMLLRTGHVDRWDVFIAAPAALSTGGLVLCSLWGYARLRSKSLSDLPAFIGVIAGVLAFFLGLFWAVAPGFLAPFTRLFA